jgi:hypothetical protein
MSGLGKTLGLVLVALFLTSSIMLSPDTAKAQSDTIVSAPAIQWQEKFGNLNSEFVSNLIQTADGCYAFLDLGSSHGVTAMKPSTFYKVDSSGNIVWTKTIDWFTASSLIQTNDGGYEISGYWNTYGTTYITTPTLIKTDSKGNVQWYENSSSPILPIYPDHINSSIMIQTSDGGFANEEIGSITKTDSNGNVKWIKNLTFSYIDHSFPLVLSSLIETSDGALAGLGVGVVNVEHDNGYIYLVKTDAFLPLPSPSQLPTPISTPIEIGKSAWLIVVVALALIVAGVVSILLYRRQRKTKVPI